MVTTVTEYRELARDANGYILPLGKGRIASQARTTAGAFASPLNTATRFIRVATDTAIRLNPAGGAPDVNTELLPANSVEYFAVNGGEQLQFS